MTTLAEIKQLTIATELIRRKLRLSIVGSLTGVSQRTLRLMWKEVHGEGAPNGKLPESVLSYITNNKIAADVAAFLGMYTHQFGDVKQFDAERLLSAQNACARLGLEVNIMLAYYALRDMRAGFIELPKCHCCGAKFVFDSSGGRHSERCPFCGDMPHRQAA